MGKEKLWKHLKRSKLILALIKPVQMTGRDTLVVPTYFSTFSAEIITDIWNIKAAIGQAEKHARNGGL